MSRGGDAAGKNPTDRGKLGTKRHLVVDAQGVPLGVAISGANRQDCKMLEETLDAVPPVKRTVRHRPGKGYVYKTRRRPAKVYADKAYDHAFCRQALKARGIHARIARRGIESTERLGRWRWIVERTQSWMNRFKRLKVCYERRADIKLAFATLGCSMICWSYVRRFC